MNVQAYLIRRDVFLNRFDGRCLKSPSSAFPPVFYERMFQSKISKISPASEIIVLKPFKCKKLAFTFMTACSTIWDNLFAKIISFLGINLAFKKIMIQYLWSFLGWTSGFTIGLLLSTGTSHNLFLNLNVLRLIEAENFNSIRLSQKIVIVDC